jgi:hypothetical protein
VLAPETRQRPSEHTPARALGPEVGGGALGCKRL